VSPISLKLTVMPSAPTNEPVAPVLPAAARADVRFPVVVVIDVCRNGW
jgi:hypothetical protein